MQRIRVGFRRCVFVRYVTLNSNPHCGLLQHLKRTWIMSRKPRLRTNAVYEAFVCFETSRYKSTKKSTILQRYYYFIRNVANSSCSRQYVDVFCIPTMYLNRHLQTNILCDFVNRHDTYIQLFVTKIWCAIHSLTVCRS